MNKITLKILILLTLLIAQVLPVFSQTSVSRTVRKDETVAFLIQQNENAREVIGKQEKRIETLEAELAAEKENSASIGKSYESAKSEIASLKQSNEALSRAVALNEQTIELLKEDNAKQRDKAKKANKEKWKARAVAAAVIALQFLL